MKWLFHKILVINSIKVLVMKSIKMKSTILLAILVLFLGIVTACTEEELVDPKTVEEYLEELNIIVATEKAAVENCVIGYNKGDFKPFEEADYDTVTNRYMDSLLLAEEIMANPDVTIEELMYANWAITDPGYEFWTRVFISDRRPLQEVIVYCDTLRVHTPVGTESGHAPYLADSIFGAAIAEAKYWRNLATTIDRQVAAEVDSLNRKLDIYEAAIIK